MKKGIIIVCALALFASLNAMAQDPFKDLTEDNVVVVYKGAALKKQVVKNVFERFRTFAGSPGHVVLCTSKNKDRNDNDSRCGKARKNLL